MSIVIVRSIFCDGTRDGGPCPMWWGEAADATADLLRKLAARSGWSRRGGKDLCPTCGEERP
jgi:hypothetical protein